MKAKKIYRKDAADLFYSEKKLNRFYSGNVPQSLSLSDVGSRLELRTKTGKRRIIQGVYINNDH